MTRIHIYHQIGVHDVQVPVLLAQNPSCLVAVMHAYRTSAMRSVESVSNVMVSRSVVWPVTSSEPEMVAEPAICIWLRLATHVAAEPGATPYMVTVRASVAEPMVTAPSSTVRPPVIVVAPVTSRVPVTSVLPLTDSVMSTVIAVPSTARSPVMLTSPVMVTSPCWKVESPDTVRALPVYRRKLPAVVPYTSSVCPAPLPPTVRSPSRAVLPSTSRPPFASSSAETDALPVTVAVPVTWSVPRVCSVFVLATQRAKLPSVVPYSVVSWVLPPVAEPTRRAASTCTVSLRVVVPATSSAPPTVSSAESVAAPLTLSSPVTATVPSAKTSDVSFTPLTLSVCGAASVPTVSAPAMAVAPVSVEVPVTVSVPVTLAPAWSEAGPLDSSPSLTSALPSTTSRSAPASHSMYDPPVSP
mmetsp:Transcript_11787/g.30757  ORF Transcript_11787/g.30757 Transcript_11787/m.30757 type:complete len:413 (-) Transcript_11787:601-1839(-)